MYSSSLDTLHAPKRRAGCVGFSLQIANFKFLDGLLSVSTVIQTPLVWPISNRDGNFGLAELRIPTIPRQAEDTTARRELDRRSNSAWRASVASTCSDETSFSNRLIAFCEVSVWSVSARDSSAASSFFMARARRFVGRFPQLGGPRQEPRWGGGSISFIEPRFAVRRRTMNGPFSCLSGHPSRVAETRRRRGTLPHNPERADQLCNIVELSVHEGLEVWSSALGNRTQKKQQRSNATVDALLFF